MTSPVAAVKETARPDLAEINRALSLLCAPGQVVELRAPKSSKKTQAGYYDDMNMLARDAARIDAPGVYIVLNEIKSDLLARSANKLKPYADTGDTTSDNNVIRRRHLPIDFDPVRVSGISSTDSEHELALHKAQDCAQFLISELGFPKDSIVVADSGNGGHVLVRIDLPNVPDSKALVKDCLMALSAIYSDDKVQIDTSVYNAARIWKLYGTVARKGDNMADRPHRLAKILIAPDKLIAASRECLERLASMKPEEPVCTTPPNSKQPFDVADWLSKHGIGVKFTGPWENATKYVLEACPFDSNHAGTSVAVFQLANGAISFKCQHNGCAGHTWADLRELKEPGYKDRRDNHSARARHARTARAPSVVQTVTPVIHTPQKFSTPPDINALRATILEHFPGVWPEALAGLAVNATLLLKDNANPTALIYVGSASSQKTTVLDFFSEHKDITYRSDKFSPKSFVSHHAAAKRESLPDIDLLPRIRHRCMVTPELAPLFRGREEELTDNFTILTAVLDGHGFTSDSGTQGRRGYIGDYLFSWLGASTPFHSKVWRIMAQLGSRLFFIAMPEDEVSDEELDSVITAPVPYRDRVAACREAVGAFLKQLWEAHDGVRGVEWDNAATSPEVMEVLRNTARVVACLRGNVSVYQDDSSGELSYTPANIEQPYRAMSILHNIARGHALLHGRKHLIMADLPLVVRIALSSMPWSRQKLIQAAIHHDGTLTTAQAAVALKVTKPTARRALLELSLLDVGLLKDDRNDYAGDKPAKLFQLTGKGKWLLSEQFKTLTEGVEKNWEVCNTELAEGERELTEVEV